MLAGGVAAIEKANVRCLNCPNTRFSARWQFVLGIFQPKEKDLMLAIFGIRMAVQFIGLVA